MSHIHERYTVDYGASFLFLKILKIYTFMTRKPKLFFCFGFWAIILLLIILCINVAYFWNPLFNALLLTYHTVPSGIFSSFFFLSFRLFFFPQKGVFTFRNSKITADQIWNILNLNTRNYVRGGGGGCSVALRPYMYFYTTICSNYSSYSSTAVLSPFIFSSRRARPPPV